MIVKVEKFLFGEALINYYGMINFLKYSFTKNYNIGLVNPTYRTN